MSDREVSQRRDRHIHYTWLVNDPEAFDHRPGPTSPDDVQLPIGLTYKEWRELFFVVLAVDPEQLALSIQTGKVVTEFEREIPKFPMLSRINNVYGDAVFSPAEIELLKEECVQLLRRTSTPEASSALRKLLQICAEAKARNLSVYLMCD